MRSRTVLLEVLSERRPVIGVVTSSLVQGPTAGTRSVWEKHRLYGEGDISSFPSSVTDSERIEVLCLYFQMLHLQRSVCFYACYEFSFRRLSVHHHGEGRETEEGGMRGKAERIKGLWHRQTAQVN